MAKQTTWTGSSNSTWSTAGNWTNGLPGTGDTAIIDGTVGITGGSGISNTEVERVYVAKSYTGAIGSVGTPLELDSAEVSIDNSATGSTHYVHLTGANNPTPTVMVDGTKTGTALYLSGDLNLLIIESTFAGTMYLGNSGTKVATVNDMTMLASAGTVDASTAANVDFSNGSVVYMTAGTFNVGENWGQNGVLTLSGGTVNVSEWTATTGDSLLMIGTNATVNWNAGSTGLTPSSVNTVNTVTVVAGTFTTAANEKAYVGLGTITQYGGTVNLQSAFPNIDINTAYNSYAGSFSFPKQSTLTTTPK